VQIRDDANQSCVIILNPSLLITQPSPLNALYSKTNISCFGANNGIINITNATGGYGTYQYSVNGGGNWFDSGNFSALTAGNYDVRIRDKAQPLCELQLEAMLEVVEPAELDAAVSSTNVTCNGAGNGTITISTPVGGFGTYQYSINGGTFWQASGNFTNLTPGTYQIRMRDAANVSCIKSFADVVITELPAISAGFSRTLITCFGANNGSITITGASGGSGSFEYTINGGGSWQAPSNFTALSPGFYNVQLRDALNPACVFVVNSSLQITEPAQLNAVVSKTNLSCFESANGIISVSSPSGGYGTYEYSVDGGSNWQLSGNFTNRTAGFYDVRIRDLANPGCFFIIDSNLELSQPDPLLPGSITGSHSVCFQGDPSILTELTVPTGGPAGILYQWESSSTLAGVYNPIGAATSANYNPPAGIAATTYYRRRVNSGTCAPEYSNILTVTVNPLPVAELTGGETICPLDPASLVVNISSGTGPYILELSDGTIENNYSSGNTITVNPAASTVYTIKSLVDVNSCAVTAPHANLTGMAIIVTNVVPEILNDPAAVTECAGETATFTVDAGGTTNPVYQWYVDRNDMLGPQLLPGEESDILSFVTNPSMNGYIYSVVVSGACPAAITSANAILTVNNLPQITSQPLPVTICSGEDAMFVVDGEPTSGASYIWYVSTSPGIWNIAFGSRYQGTFNDTLIVVNAVESMSGYEYKARVSGTCAPFVESNPVSLTVTRQAEILTQPADVSLCENEDATFTVDAGLTTGASYVWEEENTPDNWVAISGETSSSLVLPGVTSAMNAKRYRVVVSSTCGSSVNSGPARLTVYERPEILDQPDNVTICAGGNIQFTVDAGVTSGVSYQWQHSTDGGLNWNNVPSGGNYLGSTSQVLNVYGVDSAMNNNRYRVVVAGVCTPSLNSDFAVLTVQNTPKITLQPLDATLCEGSSVTFESAAVGTAISYQWQVDMRDGFGFRNFSDSAGVYAGAASAQLSVTPTRNYTNYRYRAVVTGTCSPPATTAFAVLTVNTRPEITLQAISDTICEFSGVNFNVNVQGAGLSFQWQEKVPAGVFTNLSNGGSYIGTATSSMNIFNVDRSKNGNEYRVIVQGLCAPEEISDVVALVVRTSPEIVSSPIDAVVCENGVTSFTVNAAGSGLTYQWQVSTGGGFIPLAETAPYTGTTSAVLNITNAPAILNGNRYRALVSGTCFPPAESAAGTLTVTAIPAVLFSPANAEICEGQGAAFSGLASGSLIEYRWQVDEGFGFTDIPDANTDYTGAGTNNLTISSAPAAFSNNKYRLKISNVCVSVFTDEALFIVNSNPSANISATGAAGFPIVCGGTSVTLNGNPTGGSSTYLSHSWTGSVGPLSVMNQQQTVFKTLVHDTYKLIYNVTDTKNCKASDSIEVLNEMPDARYISDAVPSCGFIVVNFTNQSERASSLSWDFGDSSPLSSIENPSHGFENFNPSGQVNYYNVKLTAVSANNCVDIDSSYVVIYPKVSSDFTIDPNVGCQPFVSMMTTQPGALTYQWNFGDGQQTTAGYSVIHEFRNLDDTVKTYQVRLVTTSFYGCRDTVVKDVTVYPLPQPGFAVSPLIQTFPEATVAITNLVRPGPWTYRYTFDDGSEYNQAAPSHTYSGPGTYTVRQIIASGSCSDSTSQTVVINPAPPTASFLTPPYGCSPHEVAFTNTSEYADSYIWSFGDGGASTKRDPVYIYFSPGVYIVRLTVSGPGGNSSYQETIEIYETPTVGFSFAPDTVFEDYNPAKFFNFTVGTANYIWDFGDINEDNNEISSQNSSVEFEPLHVYEHPGWKDVRLIAYNEKCSDTLLKEDAILVLPRKEFQFPTVFRPNPDGPTGGYYDRNDPNTRNQTFFPGVSDDVLEYSMYVYNRWGELVFESKDINIGWDGYIKNRLAAQGVYIWLVKGKYLNGENFVFKGDVTLLH
jgi:PKD repeat protein